IQFYQKLSVSGQQQQQQVIGERKTQLVVSHAQPGGSEIVQQRSTPCQFSTFKSSPVRVTPDVVSLDMSGLSLGQRDAAASPNRDYQPVSRLREPSPQLENRSNFFSWYMADKDVDREVVTFDGSPGAKRDCKEDRAASAGSLNCFGSVDRDPGDKKKGCRRADVRRHSGNVEYLDKETEFFKKIILNDSSKPRKNFSFTSKEEKAHRSLESMDRSVDLSRLNRLVLLFDDRPKTFFNCKLRSLDYSQRSKKSIDTSANKASPQPRRPNFFQRVRRSWHFLLKQRRIRRRNKYERPQSVQEKCEYFLQKYQKNEFLVQSSTPADNKEEIVAKLEDSTFRVKKDNEEDNLLDGDASDLEKEPEASPSIGNCSPDGSKDRKNSDVSNVSYETKPPDPPSNAQDPLNGNKEADVGYSTSQLGKLCLQNMKNANRNDALYSHEVAGNDKEEQFMDWIVGARLDTVSRGTNTSDSLGHGKMDRNLDTLTGILLDMFICICI
ncbi:uncharacterized protein LOC143357333, partial [Halictus rubicundus]|uniref:uncharacterized protein LOC143357333 n=1 Tax=Halictus rubicundus TaxID=77578 RepID=UPI004035A470